MARFDSRHIRLRVQDDGCGFDPEEEKAEVNSRFGMLGMRERANQLGGSLSVKSSPGHGTEIEAKVPSRA